MGKRLTEHEILTRMARSYLEHTEGHGPGFRCVHCDGFRERLEKAVKASEATHAARAPETKARPDTTEAEPDLCDQCGFPIDPSEDEQSPFPHVCDDSIY